VAYNVEEQEATPVGQAIH